MNNEDLLKSSKYFFLFAHPDDEVYCCILMNRLIKQEKEVHAIYATSGDTKGLGEIRENEVLKSMNFIGVKNQNIHFLKIPERELLENLKEIVGSILQLVKKFKPDCIIGQDYEGGHEAHDAVSFCTSEIVQLSNTPNYFVFPVYHGKPQERKGARFKPTRKNFITLKFTEQDKELKEKVLNAHKSQGAHFSSLKKSSHDYLDLLFSREVFCHIKEPINYNEKPLPEVGYEFHPNGFKFSDFLKAIADYHN